MSATRLPVAAPMIVEDLGPAPAPPVRMMPGPLGLDSPVIPDGELLPLRIWHAWMDLTADRSAGRPSSRWLLEDAMGRRLEDMWGLWWLTWHFDPGEWTVHRARVYVHDAGYTLVSACLLSLPWVGPSETVMPAVEYAPAEHVPRCSVCAELADTAATGPITLGKGAPHLAGH